MFRIGQTEAVPAAEDADVEGMLPEQEPAVDMPAEMMEEPTGLEQGKVDPSVVVYMGGEYGPFECQRCRQWQAPNSCAVVSGEIDPMGCCSIFEPANQGVAEEEAPPMDEETGEAPAYEATEEEPAQ